MHVARAWERNVVYLSVGMKGSRKGRANEDKRARARARTISFVSPFNARVNTRTSLKNTHRASDVLESSWETKNIENAFICLGHVYLARYFNNAPRRHDEIWVSPIRRNPEDKKRARKYTVRSATAMPRRISYRSDQRASPLAVNARDATNIRASQAELRNAKRSARLARNARECSTIVRSRRSMTSDVTPCANTRIALPSANEGREIRSVARDAGSPLITTAVACRRRNERPNRLAHRKRWPDYPPLTFCREGNAIRSACPWTDVVGKRRDIPRIFHLHEAEIRVKERDSETKFG